MPKTILGKADDINLSRTAAGRLRSAMQLIVGHAPGLSCQQAASFLTVALYPSRNLRQLSELASVPMSTMSRHMLDLSAYRRTRKGASGDERERAPGLGLVHAESPPDNMREKHYTLTQKGKALVNVLETILATDRK